MACDIENRPSSSIESTQFSSTLQINNQKKGKLVTGKESSQFMGSQHSSIQQASTQMQRRNSQDRVYNLQGTSNQNSFVGYVPQENQNKNRPQTSYRLATKNTFQLTNNSLTSNNGCIPQGNGPVHHQQLQPKILTMAHHNKENVGILSNTQPSVINSQA